MILLRFLVNLGGGWGVVYLVYGSSLPPTWPLVFFSDE